MKRNLKNIRKNLKRKYKILCQGVAKELIKAEIALDSKINAFKEKQKVQNLKNSIKNPIKIKNNMFSINTTGFSREQMNLLKETVNNIKKTNAENGINKTLVKGQIYYTYNTSTGSVNEVIMQGRPVDRKNLILGNTYLTKEAAQYALSRRSIEVKLRNFANVNNGEFEPKKYFYFFKRINEEGKDVIDISEYSEPVQGAIAFSSFEVANSALKVFGEDKIKKLF